MPIYVVVGVTFDYDEQEFLEVCGATVDKDMAEGLASRCADGKRVLAVWEPWYSEIRKVMEEEAIAFIEILEFAG